MKKEFERMAATTTTSEIREHHQASPSSCVSTRARGETEQEVEDTASSSWSDTLWKMLSDFPFSLRVRNNGSSLTVARRDCSLMDTTPNNDLKQFRLAVSIMTGNRRIPPWTKTTSYTEIPICKQRETWDCGVACLQMILAWIRRDANLSTLLYEEERQWMLDTLGTKSIWTIDLLVLLNTMCQQDANNKNKCSFMLCSKTLGVDREHNSLHYYEKAFSKDEVRVGSLFAKANDLGLNMVCVSHVGLAQVIRLVAQPDTVAIVLLDNSILRGTRKSYAGHYVILCGMSCDPFHVHKAKKSDRKSTDDYCMIVKNPGNENEIDYVTPHLLERAWRATGTDDDIIFVTKCQQEG